VGRVALGSSVSTQAPPEPFAEPWRVTALRTGTIAVAIGVGVGLYQRQLAAVPIATLFALWFTLGGHFVELIIRNHLQRRLRGDAPLRVVTRLAFWFAGGSALYAGALTTRAIVTGHGGVRWPWWAGGAAFAGLELVVHLFLYARGLPSFYNGRG
jgi:hypothetical protein